jgi:hypothetical protein
LVLWHVKSELYEDKNSKTKGYQTLSRKLKEINPDRETTAKQAEFLTENR